ncbi:MAG TPA: ABC transporter permease [Solirubrobacteraceae bacterium]|nr:ABC transporter permease [Solirubrobacteraceae bacterium]
MRWMLLKDLQILRRSKLLVGLLIVYPVAIALLIGFALSSGPEKPSLAFLNQIPSQQTTINFGGEKIDVKVYTNELFDAVDRVDVENREQALEKVRKGEVLAALIIPADFVMKLSNGGFDSASVEVVYNGDALKQSFVESTVESKLAAADAALARQINKVASGYIKVITVGGEINALGQNFKLLGLVESKKLLDETLADAPPRITRRLEPLQEFANIGVANIGRFTDVLNTVEEPVKVTSTVLSGRRTPLDTFAVALAVAVSLMFVCVLLASGLLALEREENTFSRLARGLVPGGQLLAGKVLLAAGCASAVTLVMLLGISAFVPLDYARVGLWIVAIAVSGIAFATLGVAIGSLAREVRAASLLALMLALPLAFLALVPSGGVSPVLYDVIQVISAIFPFKPALDAIDTAINNGSANLAIAFAHLAALTLAFGGAAYWGLRRFASA